MLVLIDESGCPGFNKNKAIGQFFVIAMIVFEDFFEAEKLSKAIARLRETLGVKPEFKFSKTKPKFKDYFFDLIVCYDFKVRALVVDKEKIYSQYFRNDKNSFYHFFVKNLLKFDGGLLNNASIKIDGSGNTVFRNKLLSYLRKELGAGKINKFKFVDSKKDNLIQLADMVAGAIARSYKNNRTESRRWLEVLSKKLEDIWEFH